MNDISLRIKKLITEKEMNISSFEKKIGVGNNSIGTIINRNSNVSGVILSKILNSFTDVNAEWLVTGKGEMFKNSFDAEDINNAFHQLNETPDKYNKEDSLLNAHKKTIAVLETVVTDLRNDKEFLKHVIDEYFKKID